MDKELRKLLKALEAAGYETRPTRNGHHVVYRKGVRITTISGTPSDRRSLLNALAPLKRRGFRWPPKD